MKLKPITLNIDKSLKIYSSDNCQILIDSYNEYYPKIGYNLPWIGYFIIKDDKIVGSCGYTGKPVDGKVEIAYWTFKEYEGQGIASFACNELISISRKTDPAIKITAKTEPRNNVSTKILVNNGFTFSEVVQDEEIGDAWLWYLEK